MNQNFNFTIIMLPAGIIFATFFFIFSLKYQTKFILAHFLKREKSKKWGNKKKPVIGGIPMFLISFTGLLIYALNGENHLNVNYGHGSRFILLTIAGLILAFLTGIVDDLKKQRPLAKFMMQCFCGLLIYISLLNSISEIDVILLFVYVFFVAGIINAINMIDNFDGVCGISSTIIILGIIGQLLYEHGSNSIFAYVFFLLLGVMIVFLVLNLPPARIFLGDSGTHVIGYLFAWYAGLKLWIFLKEASIIRIFEVITMTGALFYYPLLDLVATTTARIFHRKKFYMGGIDHTSHLFVIQLKKPWKTLLTITLIQFIGIEIYLGIIAIQSKVMIISGFLVLTLLGAFLTILHLKNYRHLNEVFNNL